MVRDNIDTDQIIPAQYLNLVPTIPEEYEKLGAYAFAGLPESDYPGLDPDEMPDIPEPPEKINLRGTEPFGGENDNAEAAE